jgi:DNA-binding transcriptional LysR family regulator
MNNGLLEHIRAFVAIAQAGSITSASIVLNVGQATLSRQLAALEKHLGCRLLFRSTRALSLTDDGKAYLRHALRLLELNDEAEAAIQSSSARMRGRLRVACSNGFARKLLIPALAEWHVRHPLVHVELVLSDQLTQLVEDRVDIAFRTAPLQESGLVARAIGASRRIVVATPDYLRRHPPIRQPADLAVHQCIVFSGAERPNTWSFESGTGKVIVHVRGRLTLSTVDALQDAVLCGLGIAVMPAWFWTREKLDGNVVQLLPDYRLPDQTIHALTSVRPGSTGRVRAFIDYVERLIQKTQ